MSPANGHTQKDRPSASGPPPVTLAPAVLHVPAERVKELVAALEVPFDPSQIEWRVMNTTKNQQPARGQVVPYADQRAYTDRLNALFTPGGWTRKYTIHTSANFERSKDQKIAAKVLVTCELTIFGLGSHSATGEEWADDDNACTSAEAQSFKRACACLGLGRYLYYFTGIWVDLDDRKRPKTVPQLTGWATPAGWLEGLRPSCAREQKPSERRGGGNGENGQHNGGASARQNGIFQEIEQTHVSRLTEKRGEGVESRRYSGPGDATESAGPHAGGRTRIASSRGRTRKRWSGRFRGSSWVFEIELTCPGGQSQNTPGDRGSARSGSTKS